MVKALSIPRRERIQAFDDLRKEGIFQYNRKEMKKDDPLYIRERAKKEYDVDNDLIMCSNCKGCYSKSYKARHQIYCGRNSGQVVIPLIPVESLFVNQMKDDFKAVVNKMIIDEVSTLAKTDPVILTVGARIYNGQKSKIEKLPEVEKRVRMIMRLLSRLFIRFKASMANSTDASDMFVVKNLCHLRKAIEDLSEDDDGATKSGLKI